MFNFDLEVVDAIYNWVSVDEDKRRGKTYRFLMETRKYAEQISLER